MHFLSQRRGGDRYSLLSLELFLDKDILFKEYYYQRIGRQLVAVKKQKRCMKLWIHSDLKLPRSNGNLVASMAPSYQNEINFDTLVEHAGDISGLDSTILSLLG